MSKNTPTVVFSYSWDSDQHKGWVRDLASRLIRNGVDAKLDDWHVQPGESLTSFMEKHIAECDHTLVICTPNYAEKSAKRKGGVGYEQQIISGNIVSGTNRSKFIPIIRDGEFETGENCAIPQHFLGIRAIDMRGSSDQDLSFEHLLRIIWRQPALVPPPLGERPTFGTESSRLLLGPLRLATPELDGYYLQSGVAKNQQYPDTFAIPDEEDRHQIVIGDLVKLDFAITPSGIRDEAEFERMWVKVIGTQGAYSIGQLENEPACEDRRNKIRYNSTIVFLPEHVINIMTVDEQDFYNEAKKYDEEIAGFLWQHGVRKEDRATFLESLKNGSFRQQLEASDAEDQNIASNVSDATPHVSWFDRIKAIFKA